MRLMTSPDLPETDIAEEVPEPAEPGDDAAAADEVEAAPDA
jgi:hypothetical protein